MGISSGKIISGCLVTIFFLLNSYRLNAQDTLYYKSGGMEIVIVQNFTRSSVMFNRLNDSNLYVVSKMKLSKVVLKNGRIYDLTDYQPEINAANSDPRVKDFGRNFLFIPITDLLANGIVTLGYESIAKSGNYGFKFTVSVGHTAWDGIRHSSYDSISPNTVSVTSRYYENGGGYFSPGKLYSIGFDYVVYPQGQGKRRYFMAMASEFGEFYKSVYLVTNRKTTGIYDLKTSYFGFIIHNGLNLQFTKAVNMSLTAGFGLINIPQARRSNYLHDSNNWNFSLRGSIVAGYKF